MPQHDTITIPKGQWTQITNADAATARVQNAGTSTIQIQARQGTGSVDQPGAIMLRQVEGVLTLDLATAYPGVSGANRLYAYSELGGKVSISHA